jgi:hypothetical protein
MPHPHKFAHLKPNIRFILLTVFFGCHSMFLKGLLGGIIFVSIQEPFKEDTFISDKHVTLLFSDSKHRGELSSSLFEDSDQLISHTSCSYL